MKSCDILILSDLVFFLSFKTRIHKSSSWCQRYFQASRTAHPTGAGSSRISAATPIVLCFLHLHYPRDVSKFSSQFSLFFKSTHFSNKDTTALRIDTVEKKKIFSLTCKVKTLNKNPDVLWPKRGCSLDFRKASLLLCSGGIWTIAGLKWDGSLQASKFGGGPRMLTKEDSYHQLLFNYRSACSPSQILQTFWKETGDIWTCTLQRTV